MSPLWCVCTCMWALFILPYEASYISTFCNILLERTAVPNVATIHPLQLGEKAAVKKQTTTIGEKAVMKKTPIASCCEEEEDSNWGRKLPWKSRRLQLGRKLSWRRLQLQAVMKKETHIWVQKKKRCWCFMSPLWCVCVYLYVGPFYFTIWS